MILKSIIIDNIRSYKHEEIEFPTGISLFEGDIGSGKSTILMSIEFALFGLGSQKPESLLAKKSDSCSVLLEFSVDDKIYEVKRTLVKKTKTVGHDPKGSWIKISGVKELLSPSELKQKILQILKFNEPSDPKAESRIFRYAVFTPQESMKDVLWDSKRRLETIRKAFGIEDYSIAASNAHELLRKLNLKTNTLQERFSNISELESQNTESENKISELDSALADLMQKKELDEKSELQATATLKELHEKNKEKVKIDTTKQAIKEKINDLQTQVSRIKKEIEELQTNLESDNLEIKKLAEIVKPETVQNLSQLEEEISKHQKINDNLIKLDATKDAIITAISKLKESLGDNINTDALQQEQKINTIQNQKDTLLQQKKEIEANKDTLLQQKNTIQNQKDTLLQQKKETDQNRDEINGQLAQKAEQIRALESEIAEFTKLGNVCPTCKQEITSQHNHDLVGKKQNEIDELKQQKDAIFASFSKIEAEQNSINSEINSCDSDMDKIRDVAVAELHEKQNSINSEINSCDSGIDKVKQIASQLHDYAFKSSELEQIGADILELHRQRGVYGDDSVRHFTELKERLIQYENAQERIQQIVSSKQKTERKILENQDLEKSKSKEISLNTAQLDKLQTMYTFDDLDAKIDAAEKTLQTLQNSLSQMNSTAATVREKISNEKILIQKNCQKITESKKWQKEFHKISEYSQWLESFFIPTISQIEKQVLLSILQNFNQTYSNWYLILVEDPAKESRIDEDFTPIVTQDGYDQEVSYLSGGEKTSIALAYRLTLNSLIRKETQSMKSNLLILDEPTDGFSKNQLGKIREVLNQLQSEQIILVSHEKELETYVEHVFEISKQDGISKVSHKNLPAH